jgi:SAM-dependent methyltransferase
VAINYDDYFAFNSLFDFDEQVLARHFTPPGLVADLGCGTGRALLPIVRSGHRGLAIDLSPHMLAIVREKAAEELLPNTCIRANLVELDALRDRTVDHAMCLFSTLGMIQGRENRQRMLAHVRRILRPGGRFVLHVHNYWFNLWDPGGPWWVVSNLLAGSALRNIDVGDKFFHYRGVPNMFLHVFRPGELRRAVAEAGFRIVEWIPLDVARRHPLRRPWLAESLRANGWIVVCE